MKKVNWYLVVVLVGVLSIISITCNRNSASAFRIVRINEGSPLTVDVFDWAQIPNPQDPDDSISVGFVKDWFVPVEVSYSEIGLGLPTYPTNYTARITDYKVNFKLLNDTNSILAAFFNTNSVNGNINILVPSDPQRQTTVKAYINLIPKEWIQRYIEPYAEPDSSNIPGGMVKTTVILSGYEELTRNPVTDTTNFTVNIGDYWDDPIEIGQ